MKRSGLIVIGFIMLIMVPDLLKSHTVGDVQFPKVSFLDPYWAYEARDLFYYQELQDLGINLLVTKGKDLNLDSIAALPESLWVWNADLDGAVKKYAYGKEFTQKMDRLDDPTEGVGRLLDNYEYYSNPNEPDVHTQGYLVPPSSVGNERIHNVNAYYFLKCKIPAGYDDTTTVIRFELVETNTLREIPQEEDGSENHGILDEVQEVTDHDTPVSYSFEVTVGDLSGLPPDPSEYVTWQSPIVNVSKKFELSLSVYWYGNIEFWLKGIQVRDYYNNRLVHNPSAIAGTLQSILNNRYNLNPALHFGWYIDEPDTTEYEAYHLVDSIGGLLGLPDHMRLNGATGGKGPSRIQKFVDKIEPDQLLYNKYPFKRRSSQHNIWADQLPDTASDTDPSIYNLQNVWDEWYLNSIKPVAEICYSSSPVIPFWMTIQTVGEKVLDAAGDNFIYRFRDPTTAEIACQVNLALAYGAKGIMYYLYPTGNFGSLYLSNGLVNVTGGSPDTIEWTDSNDSLRVTIIPAEYDHTANYVTNYKYDAVQDVNEQLDLIAPVILSSDLIWKNGFTLIEEEDEGPAIDNVVKKLTLSPQFTKAYIEVSNLENLSTGEKYFWLINRRCLSDEQQTIRLELEFDDPSIGHLLTDVFAVQNGLPIEDTYTYFDVGEDQFNVTLDPGEGKLFRIEKSIPGIITNDFTIESMAYFGTDCIIEAGATVTIKPGTRVIVNRSTQIDVEGELIIDGTPDSLIEFGALTDNPSYNFWTGIFVESGGDLLIRDARIKDAFYGINVQNAFAHSDVKMTSFENCYFGYYVINNDDIIIEDNSFTENRYSIYIRYSDITIKGNSIKDAIYNGVFGYYSNFSAISNIFHNNTNRALNLYNSNPTVRYNDISGSDRGIYCTGYSHPNLTSKRFLGDNSVNNYIHENHYGVYNSSTSGPELGLYSQNGNLVYGGFNFFEQNTNYDAYNNSLSADIYAQVNWWERNVPHVTGDIDTDHQADVVMSMGPGTLPKLSTMLEEIGELYSRGLAFELDSAYTDAIAVYDSAIVNCHDCDLSISSLRSIERCYSKLDGSQGLIEQLEVYYNQYQGEFIGFLAYYFSAGELARSGDFNGSITRLEECVLIFETHENGDEGAAWALFDIGQIYEMLAELEEGLSKTSAYLAKANSSYNKILSKYPGSEAAGTLREFDQDDKPIVVLPTAYKLNHPFPNPFNPITTIKYELPEITDVSITIYDILGRSVWAYEESAKPAGYYSLQWSGLNQNGKQAASGVYLISFSTPEFKAVQKVLLIR